MKNTTKVILMLMLLFTVLWSDDTPKIALFGKIVHVNEDDILNMREKPDHKSKKIGEIPPVMSIGIDRCIKNEKSVWCKVHELVAYGDDKTGWVNAYYLSFHDKGYVTIKEKKNNCFYALKCKNRVSKTECLVVLDYTTNTEGNAKELKTKWFDRALLRGESQFGAASSDMEGYCITGKWIEDYLKRYPDFLK